MELYEFKELKVEIVNVFGDFVGVNLFDEFGLFVVDVFVKFGFVLF